MSSNKIIVKTKSKLYPIYIGDKIINKTGNLIKKKLPNVRKICILIDRNVPSQQLNKLINSLKKYNLKTYRLTVNEKTKSFKFANKLTNVLSQKNVCTELMTVKNYRERVVYGVLLFFLFSINKISKFPFFVISGDIPRSTVSP